MFGLTRTKDEFCRQISISSLYDVVGDTDFDIKSIEGESNDFKVELEDGRTAMFKYGLSDEPMHFVNETDLMNYGGEPLKTLFSFLFSNAGDYELNRKMSLNAIRLSEKVKEWFIQK